MDIDEELQSTNTELRYLTLELMKLAQKNNTSFEVVVKKYVQNVKIMQQLISESVGPSGSIKKTKNFLNE